MKVVGLVIVLSLLIGACGSGGRDSGASAQSVANRFAAAIVHQRFESACALLWSRRHAQLRRLHLTCPSWLAAASKLYLRNEAETFANATNSDRVRLTGHTADVYQRHQGFLGMTTVTMNVRLANEANHWRVTGMGFDGGGPGA